jgi:ABC-type polysaccharide/polyol phosphate transport system ATPase subunit
MAVAILHAYFRDVAPILAAILVPWFFVTPIFFTPTAFPGLDDRPWLGDLLRWANPVAPFIEAVRDFRTPRRALSVQAPGAGAGGGPVSAQPGEVILEHASRAFVVRADPARTIKDLFIGRGRDRAGPPPIHALRDVTLHVSPGEALGIMGRNGAGKTSTLRVLSGIVPLDSGAVECGGRVVSLLEVGAGFGRDFSGRENIHLNGALHGLGKADVDARLEQIIAFSELGDFIDVPVRTYSSGMFVRLGFSIAAHLDADVMLIDEVLAVGDEAFQRKCLERIRELMAAGMTLVLVSHDAGTIETVCDRVVVLDEGRVAFDGPTADALAEYRRLLAAHEGQTVRA